MIDARDEPDEVRILDDHGCLTLEAMCYTHQLQPDHRGVVERHVGSCAVCAQQQMGLARITERVRSARPRVPVPGEVLALAREVALRSVALRRAHRSKRPEMRSTARLRALDPQPRPWYRSGTFWAALIVGMAGAVVVALLVVLLL